MQRASNEGTKGGVGGSYHKVYGLRPCQGNIFPKQMVIFFGQKGCELIDVDGQLVDQAYGKITQRTQGVGLCWGVPYLLLFICRIFHNDVYCISREMGANNVIKISGFDKCFFQDRHGKTMKDTSRLFQPSGFHILEFLMSLQNWGLLSGNQTQSENPHQLGVTFFQLGQFIKLNLGQQAMLAMFDYRRVYY